VWVLLYFAGGVLALSANWFFAGDFEFLRGYFLNLFFLSFFFPTSTERSDHYVYQLKNFYFKLRFVAPVAR